MGYRKAQSFIEYAGLIIIVTGALMAMYIYFQRAYQERVRQSADTFGQGEQYEVNGLTGVTNER